MIYLLALLACYWGWNAAAHWHRWHSNEVFWRYAIGTRNHPFIVLEAAFWPITELICIFNNGNLPRVLLFLAKIGRKP